VRGGRCDDCADAAMGQQHGPAYGHARRHQEGSGSRLAQCRCVARYTEGHMSNGWLQPVCCRWLLARSICRADTGGGWWWWVMMYGKSKRAQGPRAKQSWSVNLDPCRERPSSIGFPSQSPSLCIPGSLSSMAAQKTMKCMKVRVSGQNGLFESMPRSTIFYAYPGKAEFKLSRAFHPSTRYRPA